MYFEKLKRLQVNYYMLPNFQFGVNIILNFYTSIVKINATNSISWQASYLFQPAIKSLSVDSVEQYFYFAFISNLVTIIQSDVTNGAVVSASNIKSFKMNLLLFNSPIRYINLIKNLELRNHCIVYLQMEESMST